MKAIIQILVVVVLAFLIFKWWKNHQAAPTAAAGASPSQECAAAAGAAGDAWGSGVGRFANPPYDAAAWDEFRSRIEKQARQAQEKCLCGDAACNTAKGAMSDLRSLVNEMDSALRSGSPPPSDLVQRQEAIDNAINAAREAAK